MSSVAAINIKKFPFIPIASVAALITIWWLGSLGLGRDSLPTPLDVLAVITRYTESGELFVHIGITLWRVIASFTLAIFIGMTIGLLMGVSNRANEILDPWLLFFLNLPALVVIILAYIWLGLTEVAAVLAVAVNKIPNVVVTLREGARAMDSGLQNMALVFQFGWWKKLRHVVMPQLAPYIAAATRSGISLIWKIVLVVELLGRSDGVGFQLHLQFQLFNIAGIMAWGLTFVIIMQFVELFLVQPFERYVNRWRK